LAHADNLPDLGWRRRRLLLFAGGSLPILLGAQTTLEIGKTIEARLGDGESHKYSFALESGQYARVLVDQRSINVAIKLFAPNGEEIFAADSETIGASESTELIAEVPGNYRLRLTTAEPHAPAGQYAITWKDVEPATERHRMRVAAAREFARGISSYAEGTREGILKAIDHLGGALADWRAAQDRAAESRALVTIGLYHAETGNRDKAFEFATQALPVAQDSRDPLAEARALDALGQVNYYFGDRRKAIAYYEQALPLMRAKADRAAEGSTLSNLAIAHRRTGEKRKALAYLDEAMRIFRELQDRRMMAEVSGNMGVTYDDLGEYQKALESHQNDLALKRELGERASQAIAWNNVGMAYAGLAAYQKSLDAYDAALEINRSMDNRWNIAINLNNIAWVYGQLADHQRALSFLSGVARALWPCSRHDRRHAQQYPARFMPISATTVSSRCIRRFAARQVMPMVRPTR
jgi:tetratricopeptide (TPR) repeat protein